MADFGRAADEFVNLVARVPPDRFAAPGLGEWTLLELIGHTSRALSTVTSYLQAPEPAEVTVHSAAEYLEVVLRQRGDDEAIALRGKAAGAAFDSLPTSAVMRLAITAVEAVDAVDAAGLERRIAVGGEGSGVAMVLGEYLRTRVFELTVHGIDIADAAGIEWTPPSTHLVDALHLAAVNASARHRGVEALRYLTGRRPDAGLKGVLSAGG